MALVLRQVHSERSLIRGLRLPVALAAASATTPAAAPAASCAVPVLSGQDKDIVKSFLKLSAVLDQTSDEEFQLMSRVEADDCFKVYDMRLGGAPPDDQEPTVAQLFAMKHVVTHGCVPYADFGAFGATCHSHDAQTSIDGAYAWTVG